MSICKMATTTTTTTKNKIWRCQSVHHNKEKNTSYSKFFEKKMSEFWSQICSRLQVRIAGQWHFLWQRTTWKYKRRRRYSSQNSRLLKLFFNLKLSSCHIQFLNSFCIFKWRALIYLAFWIGYFLLLLRGKEFGLAKLT